MAYYDLIDGLSNSDIEAALSDMRFARLDVAATPLICFAGTPAQIIFANDAALRFFAANDLRQLADILLKTSPSSVRLNELARSMRAGLPPRTERLRFYHGLHAEYASYQLRRAAGTQPILIMSALGVRIELDATAADYEQSFVPTPKHAVQHQGALSAPMRFDAIASEEDVRLYHRHLFGDAPSVRFLWQTDAQGMVSSITGPLCEAIGWSVTDLVGHHLISRIASYGVDVRALTEALHRSDTFSGIEFMWPLKGLKFSLPVSLGAIASFDPQRQFDGFRGYGIVYIHDVHNDERDLAPLQSHKAEDAPVPITQTISSSQEVITATPDALEAESPAPASMENQILGDNVVPLRLWQERVAAQNAADDKAQDDKQDETTAARASLEPATPIVSDHAAPHDADDLTPAQNKAAPSEPSKTKDDEGDHLSPAERLAFREIARALGARTRNPSPPPPPQTSEPATPLTAGEPSAPPAPTPTSHQDIKAARDQDMLALSANAHQLIDRLPVGILVTRAEIPLFLNRTFLDFLGFADADAFHDAGGLDHLFKAGGVDPQADEGAIHITGKNGETIALECRVQRIMWDDQPATLMSFRRAIEPEAQALINVLEGELSRTEAETRELHAILDTATDGVAVLDHRGRILSLNRAGEALFGFEQNDVAGESITSLLAPESHAAALDYLSGLQANGVASVLNDGREIMGRAKQGGTLPIFMTLGRLQAGGETKFCAVLRDMTPWKRAESELRDARREAERVSALKSDFLAKMSHEIRTPLNAILGFAEVIMEERFGAIGNERYKDYLKDIHASGAHVMSLINDLLDLSKIEAGKLELNFTSVDANKIVGECVHLMQPQANRERVIIRQSLAPRLPMIVADERALRQIILNLLSNAIKFNEAGGQVIMSTAMTDAGHAVIRIRDTGIGMSESDVQTALEPFRQLATTRQSAGTGLGLPLTKALVEANRASFVIRSQKNKGTLVEVTFPPTRVLAE